MAQLVLDAQTAALLNTAGTNTGNAYSDGIGMSGQGADIPGITGYSDLSSQDKTKATDGIKSTIAGLLQGLSSFSPVKNIVTVFLNGTTTWGDVNYNNGQVSYRKSATGEVYLEGLARIVNTYVSGEIALFTLPVGFRPAPNDGKIFATICNDNPCSIQVLSDGVVKLRSGGAANGWLALDVVRFPVGG